MIGTTVPQKNQTTAPAPARKSGERGAVVVNRGLVAEPASRSYYFLGMPGIAGMPDIAAFVAHSAAADVALVIASASPLLAEAMSEA
jgi:hypothetical protein